MDSKEQSRPRRAMIALTICQPYARLIVPRLDDDVVQKRVENRTWPVPRTFKGRPLQMPFPLLIHAGLTRKWLGTYEDMEPTEVLARFPNMVFGALVGQVEVVACLPHLTSAIARDLTARFAWVRDHTYASGPWCWVLEKARRFDVPIPCRGRQGLFNVELQVLSAGAAGGDSTATAAARSTDFSDGTENANGRLTPTVEGERGGLW